MSDFYDFGTDDEYEVPEVAARFVQLTAEVAPELAPILIDHVDFHEELLPHVYFGDVSRWATEKAAAKGQSAELTSLLHLLESTYPTADFYVQNLIDVSFVEMVQDDPAVVRLFGPTLRSRVDPEYQL